MEDIAARRRGKLRRCIMMLPAPIRMLRGRKINKKNGKAEAFPFFLLKSDVTGTSGLTVG